MSRIVSRRVIASRCRHCEAAKRLDVVIASRCRHCEAAKRLAEAIQKILNVFWIASAKRFAASQ